LIGLDSAISFSVGFFLRRSPPDATCTLRFCP
jgi:hypothetical protein